MPLVVLCGFPASGKTFRCRQLFEYLSLEYPSKKVHVITDHTEGLNRQEVYSNSLKERELRGNLKSSVQRLLGKDDVVILDALNYIKGFRYELFCVAKACRTPQCVIYCVTDAETSKAWNNLKDETDRYSSELIDELIMRFECPSPLNRWDKPLFTVIKDGCLNMNEICCALFTQKAAPPNQSTQTQPLSSTNFLYEVDKITQDIVTLLVAAQKSLVPGSAIKIPDVKEEFVFIRHVSIAELQRHRRQFITYTKMHPVEDSTKLSNMFVQYLNKSLMN
ncbi:unnamed protein product [Lymnaea stagnalis]|uniref:Protein KTI12 homolog n=1 Tax=Lymnaea stagnalis TaxID=6523 RepID=A0AAV2H876_LYMST